MKPIKILLILIFSTFILFSNSQGAKSKEKKLIVEVEPADYDNEVFENLRDQEDSSRRFGMDDLSTIIEKVTRNRYYPYMPGVPSQAMTSQYMLPNTAGYPYMGPYTVNSQSRFKEVNNEKSNEKNNNDIEIKKYNEHRFISVDNNSTLSLYNYTNESNSNYQLKLLEEKEKKFLENKLNEALFTLNQLNEKAKKIVLNKKPNFLEKRI